MLKSNKGLTLIEIIIVIAIIGVLLAITTPNLLNYIKDSKVAVDKINARTIETGIVSAQAQGIDLKDKDAILQHLKVFLNQIPKIKASGYFQYNVNTGVVTIIQSSIASPDNIVITDNNISFPTSVPENTPIPNSNGNNGNHYGQEKDKDKDKNKK